MDLRKLPLSLTILFALLAALALSYSALTEGIAKRDTSSVLDTHEIGE